MPHAVASLASAAKEKKEKVSGSKCWD